MSRLKGTKTEKNLVISFVGECISRNKYTFFAEKAKSEGFHAIAKIFEETAGQEKEHGKRFFKFLEGGNMQISIEAPAGKIGTTLENLQSAAYGEQGESDEMYPEFAEIAASEGFDDIAETFLGITNAEDYHEIRYKTLFDAISKGTLFKKDSEVIWRCVNCGNHVKGKEAPTVCPGCNKPQDYFISDDFDAGKILNGMK